MSQVKLNLNRISVDQKIQLATGIHAAMTGNAHFATPNPTLAALQTSLTALQTAAT